MLLSAMMVIKIMYKCTHSRPRRAWCFWFPSSSSPHSSSSSSSSSTSLVLPSPHPSPWFSSLLRSIDDVATVTDTFHAWRRDWFTAWPRPRSILSHNPDTTHHDDRIHVHVDDSEDDVEAWKERINAIQQGIETARANIHMEKEDEKEDDDVKEEHKVSDTAPAATDIVSSTPVSSSVHIDTVISTSTRLCADVTSHISSLPSILCSHITSIASSLSSTNNIITSSMNSFTWVQDRMELAKMLKTWRGNGNQVAFKHLINTFETQVINLLKPWKILKNSKFHCMIHPPPPSIFTPKLHIDILDPNEKDRRMVRMAFQHVVEQKKGEEIEQTIYNQYGVGSNYLSKARHLAEYLNHADNTQLITRIRMGEISISDLIFTLFPELSTSHHILSFSTTQLYHSLQTIIHDRMHFITYDMNGNHNITIYGYENILMSLYLLRELLPCIKHPITHVNLPQIMIDIMTINEKRIHMIHQAHNTIYDIQQDDPSRINDQAQHHLQKILHVIDQIQQARMITQEMVTTTPIIIPIPNDNVDSKSDSELSAPAYMIWKKLLIQAQDNVTGIQAQLEKLQALKQEFSNHLTTEIAHFQSFTDCVDALRDTSNESIQHMNGTLNTIMIHATRGEKCVIRAQQHVDLCHGWKVQQQTWYTTWIKQLDESIISLQHQLTEQQHRITLLHHLHDSCLLVWKQITTPIDKVIDDATKTCPQLDIQWMKHIKMAEQILINHQQQIVTTTKTLQEKIQNTEEEWKQAQEQHNGCLSTSLSSQLSMLREQLQGVKAEQEMWNTFEKTLQDKKEAGTAVTAMTTEIDAKEVKTPTPSTSTSGTPSSTTAASLTLSDSDLLDIVPPLSASTPSPSVPIPPSFGRATSPITPSVTPITSPAPALAVSIPVISTAIVSIDSPLAASHHPSPSPSTTSFDVPIPISDPHVDTNDDNDGLEPFDPDSPAWNSELEIEMEQETTQNEQQQGPIQLQQQQQQQQTSTLSGIDTATLII